jgi:hypothetical protein
MRNTQLHTFAISVVALTVLIGVTLLAQQERYTLKCLPYKRKLSLGFRESLSRCLRFR